MEAQERTEDGTKPALRVRSLVEVEAFKRRCSDRLLNMPRVDEVTDDLYNVCCVLPQNPTDEQLGDLAFRLSNFLEDVHRAHVDRRVKSEPLGMLSLPMSLPVVHRAKLREAKQRYGIDHATLLQLVSWPEERETVCMVYLNVPRWRCGDGVLGSVLRIDRVEQIVAIDAVARRHGLRCVEMGIIPQD